MPGIEGNFGAVPLIQGAQERRQQEQVALSNMMFQCFFSLIPVVAAKRLEARDEALEKEACPAKIVNEAWDISAAAMKRCMGITMNGPPELPVT